VSSKPAETRQGTGKGEIEYWTAVVKPGTVIYELAGCTEDAARKAFNRVAHKLPVKVRMISRRHA
jgi:large subunit ribosomal protein L16